MVSGWTKDNDMLRLHTPCETPSVGTDAPFLFFFSPHYTLKANVCVFLGASRQSLHLEYSFLCFTCTPPPSIRTLFCNWDMIGLRERMLKPKRDYCC